MVVDTDIMPYLMLRHMILLRYTNDIHANGNISSQAYISWTPSRSHLSQWALVQIH